MENGVTSQDPFQDQSLYVKGMQELSKLDFTTQTAIASLYRDFYEDFKEFFEKFKEQNIVITQVHIQEFFAQLKGKNKDIPAWA
jgi:glutathione peroxidase-family protein